VRARALRRVRALGYNRLTGRAAKGGDAKEGRVDKLQRKGQRLVALCMLGCLLFNYPILALFNRAATVWGIPMLYAYIFVVWAALIALMGWVVESRE
jgi:hypothetical protein